MKHIFSTFSQIQEKTCHFTITYRPLSIDPRRKLKRLADIWHCCFQDWSLFFCCAVNAWCIKTKQTTFFCVITLFTFRYTPRGIQFFSHSLRHASPFLDKKNCISVHGCPTFIVSTIQELFKLDFCPKLEIWQWDIIFFTGRTACRDFKTRECNFHILYLFV